MSNLTDQDTPLPESAPCEIRTLHHYGFRKGEWALVTDVKMMRPQVHPAFKPLMRPVYEVTFPDGVVDHWVLEDKDGNYEFRPQLEEVVTQ